MVEQLPRRWSTLHIHLRSFAEECDWPVVDDLVEEVRATPDPDTLLEARYAVMTLRYVLRALSERGRLHAEQGMIERFDRLVKRSELDPVVSMAARMYQARLEDDRSPALLLIEQFVDRGFRHKDGRMWSAETLEQALRHQGAPLDVDAHMEAHAILEAAAYGVRAINERALTCDHEELAHLARLVKALRGLVPGTMTNPYLARTEAATNIYWHLGCGGVFGSMPAQDAHRYLGFALSNVQPTPLQRATFAPLQPIQAILQAQLALREGEFELARLHEREALIASDRAAQRMAAYGLEATLRRYQDIGGRLLPTALA